MAVWCWSQLASLESRDAVASLDDPRQLHSPPGRGELHDQRNREF
ncbi:MAG: hypothetical protein QXX62_11605 [Metallosphaera sp.]|nr:hypothetical protein [Metallosphaera sedula]